MPRSLWIGFAYHPLFGDSLFWQLVIFLCLKDCIVISILYSQGCVAWQDR